MVMDIFSSLDFSSNKGLFNFITFNTTNFVVIYLIIMSMISMKFFDSDLFNVIFKLSTVGGSNFKVNSHISLKYSYILIVTMFKFMLGLNLLGLFPYLFSISSQVVISMSISLIMWLSVNLSKFNFNFISFFAHLTPLGSPTALNPMLKVMELVSNLMRFLTLSLRLSINMTTGHVFLTLISMFICKSFFNSSLMVNQMILFLGVGYMVFELAMGFIQAFVFSLLCSQYLDEHSL